MNWATINKNRGMSAEKYQFYFGTYDFKDFGKGKISKSLPVSRVGWGKRAVEMRANKTHFDRFENDALNLNDIMKRYKIYEAFNILKDDILVGGCGFLALVGDKVLPFTSEEATGRFSWNTLNLDYGVAVFNGTASKFGNKGIPRTYIEYFPDRTVAYDDYGNKKTSETPNATGRPLIALLTYDASVKKPFGHSVLSSAARGAIIDASRTLRQAMIAAYYYNSKVDVILGADSGTPIDAVESQTGDILKIGPNKNGETPSLGQFAQHAMTPFSDTMLIAARNFCSDTKLSLANLGISSDAPQSPEALEIVGDDLKDDITEWHSELGQQLKQFAFTIFMYEQGISKIDANLTDQLDNTVPVWKPIYRSDFSKFGDGLVKIAQYAPAALKTRSIWRNLGLSSQEIDDIVESISLAEIQ